MLTWCGARAEMEEPSTFFCPWVLNAFRMHSRWLCLVFWCVSLQSSLTVDATSNPSSYFFSRSTPGCQSEADGSKHGLSLLEPLTFMISHHFILEGVNNNYLLITRSFVIVLCLIHHNINLFLLLMQMTVVALDLRLACWVFPGQRELGHTVLHCCHCW